MNLKIPEHLQRRVLDYYDRLLDGHFVRSNEFYNFLSLSRTEYIKLYQIHKSVGNISFIHERDVRQIEKFVLNLELGLYLPDDVIIKQGEMNKYFYYIHSGLIEVVQQKEDFMYFDYTVVNKIFNSKEKNQQSTINISESKNEEVSVFDASPTHNELFKRQMSKNLPLNTTLEQEDFSDIPEGSVISDISLVKRSSSKQYEDSESQIGKEPREENKQFYPFSREASRNNSFIKGEKNQNTLMPVES